MQVAGFAMIPLDISDFPTRHNYGLALWQNRIERILAAWVDELAVPIYRGREVTGFAQDDTGVDVELSDGGSLRAKYLVGCDGGRSLIRKKAGIDFPGWDPSVSYLIAEVEMTGEPELGIRRGDKGINGLGRLEDGKRVRAVLIEQQVSARRRADPRTIFARRSSPSTGPTTVFTTPRGSRGSPIRPGRRRPTERDACSWPATRRTCIPRQADKDSTSVSRTP